MMAMVWPFGAVAFPSFFNCLVSMLGSESEPGADFGNGATKDPVIPNAYGVSHASGEMSQPKSGVFCWVRNCIGGTEVSDGTMGATPSCCTSRCGSASA